MNTVLTVNVAPTSEAGHFVKGATKVVMLDEINETFDIKGTSVLETKKHTTLVMEEDCTIFCQVVYNSKLKRLEKARD
jgi:hypothetical protein